MQYIAKNINAHIWARDLLSIGEDITSDVKGPFLGDGQTYLACILPLLLAYGSFPLCEHNNGRHDISLRLFSHSSLSAILPTLCMLCSALLCLYKSQLDYVLPVQSISVSSNICDDMYWLLSWLVQIKNRYKSTALLKVKQFLMYYFRNKTLMKLIYSRADNVKLNYKLAKQVLQPIALTFLYSSVLGLNLCLNTATINWVCWWLSSDPSGKLLLIVVYQMRIVYVRDKNKCR